MGQPSTTKNYVADKLLHRQYGTTEAGRPARRQTTDALVKVASDGGIGLRLEYQRRGKRSEFLKAQLTGFADRLDIEVKKK